MFNNKIKEICNLKPLQNKNCHFLLHSVLMAVLTSCGSFQYAGYDNDGIYTTDNYDTNVEQPVATTSTEDTNYYKNYFAENSAQIRCRHSGK